MPEERMTFVAIGEFLRVSTKRARQVAKDDPTFPSPATERPRRWSRAEVERWAEREWWDTRRWKKR
jgi:hypothetical protein